MFFFNRVTFGKGKLLSQGDTASQQADMGLGLGLGLNLEFSAFFLIDSFVCMTLIVRKHDIYALALIFNTRL